MVKSSYILVIRPAEEAQSYAKKLEALGYQVLVEPILEIRPRDFSRPDLSQYQGLVFTSAEAVKIFGPSEETAFPVFAVGSHTAEAAQKAGYNNVISADGDGYLLAEIIARHIKETSKPLLHPRGEDVAVLIGELLKTSGISVESLIVYKAEAVKAFSSHMTGKLAAGEIEAVTFFSKRSAENFLSVISENNFEGKLGSIKALCISKAVLECVQLYKWQETYTAETPDGSGVTELVTQYCGGNFTRKVKTL